MASKFVVKQIETKPKDTGVSQYIKIKVQIIEYTPDTKYAKTSNTEVYAGEATGLL